MAANLSSFAGMRAKAAREHAARQRALDDACAQRNCIMLRNRLSAPTGTPSAAERWAALRERVAQRVRSADAAPSSACAEPAAAAGVLNVGA